MIWSVSYSRDVDSEHYQVVLYNNSTVKQHL